MMKTQFSTYFGHHVVSEMRPMICHDGLRYAEPSNNVIKNEQCSSIAFVSECRHYLSPLGKLIDCDNSVLVPPD